MADFKRGDLIKDKTTTAQGTVWRYLGKVGTNLANADHILEWSGEGEPPFYSFGERNKPERLWRTARIDQYEIWTPKPVKDELWDGPYGRVIVREVTEAHVVYVYVNMDTPNSLCVRTRENFAEELTKVPDDS